MLANPAEVSNYLGIIATNYSSSMFKFRFYFEMIFTQEKIQANKKADSKKKKENNFG